VNGNEDYTAAHVFFYVIPAGRESSCAEKFCAEKFSPRKAVKSDGEGTHRTLQQACMKWIPASAVTVSSKVGMPGG
jgi:hypothetical protein